MMTLTQFELWIKGCEDNKTIVYCLEGSGDTALYKTLNEYWYRNNRFYTKPVYHVWKDGERFYCGTNMNEAYKWWKIIDYYVKIDEARPLYLGYCVVPRPFKEFKRRNN